MTGKLRYINGVFLWIVVFLFGCNSPSQTQIPGDIIQPPLMKEIIFDLNLAETKLLRRNLQVYEQEAQRQSDLAFVLRKHQVSDSLFETSYDFYSQSPEHFKLVLEGAIEIAEKESQKLNNEDSLSQGKN